MTYKLGAEDPYATITEAWTKVLEIKRGYYSCNKRSDLMLSYCFSL